jgi:hypothetical protein
MPVPEEYHNADDRASGSATPFARVDVLGYGDDPAVEPGETAVRVFIDRAGRPEENWDSRETLDESAKANSEGHAFEAGLGPYEKLPGEPDQHA